jgi:hypothetical protein
MNDSMRATTTKSGSVCASFAALIFPQNSSTPASGCRPAADCSSSERPRLRCRLPRYRVAGASLRAAGRC